MGRIAVISSVILMYLWTLLGVASWPYIYNEELAAFPLDMTFWTVLTVLANLVPLVKQLTYSDANVRFGGPHEDEAEAIWRDWFRQSGITRADFKMIIQSAEWLKLSQKETLETSIGEGPTVEAEEEIYYYCVGGRVELAWELNPTAHTSEAEWTSVGPGEFVNGLSLLALLGQAHVGLALREGAASARVAADSSFVLSSPRRDAALGSDGAAERGLDHVRKGCFLLRWRRSDLVSQVLNQPCNAATAMRLCANQSCLHSIYRDALPLHMRCRFDEACEKRRQLNLSPLPRGAATSRTSFFKQWKLSHVSLNSLWEPSPLERAINALQVGSQEWEHMHKLRAGEEQVEKAEQHNEAMTPEMKVDAMIVTSV